MYQRILVALGEEAAINQKVLSEATAIAQATQATLNLLHVLFPPNAGFPDPVYLTADGMHSTVTTESFQLYMSEWQTLQHTNQQALDAQANQLSTQGIAAEWTQAVGDPGRQICKISKDWNADLIILGRRGRIGLGEFFLGSVSNYVMHHSPCSVIAVQGLKDAATQTLTP
ncbi:MAG: universal stress protein [Leptolyngbya sp. SIO1E4]|nr:universal stress protein [Leptolyngbya sp. SIO1E4]